MSYRCESCGTTSLLHKTTCRKGVINVGNGSFPNSADTQNTQQQSVFEFTLSHEDGSSVSDSTGSSD